MPSIHYALTAAKANRILIIYVLLFWTASEGVVCISAPMSLNMVHKFSAEAKEFWNRRNGDGFCEWPVKGTRKYYNMLYKHDWGRHGRKLISYDSLFFAAGNETKNYGEEFGWLHYGVLDIGTPNTSFVVALDTGSDLLWVPCECKRCAPSSSARYGREKSFNIYTPSASNTSKHVTCSSPYCELGHMCKSKTAVCPYSVQYLSDNTSTSGILVEDVIYLTSVDQRAIQGSVTTSVIFGCGQLQSGGFLDGGAPDGLLGLGLGAISIPNFLAKAGLVKNSFSMCFQPDDSGRIFFGDEGISHQQTTPFLPINDTYVVYMVAVEHIVVGSSSVKFDVGLEMLIDSGTSFTYLPSEVYSLVTTQFDDQVKQKRMVFPEIPWEYCYEASKSQDLTGIPAISVVFHGGGNFSIYSALIGLYDEHNTLEAFCLGLLQGELAILGQNFMTSYRLVFDREKLKLGWSPSDCYKLEQNSSEVAAAPPTTQETGAPLKAPSSTTAPPRTASPPKHVVPPTKPSATPIQDLHHTPSGQPSSGHHPKHLHLFCLSTLVTIVVILF